MEHKQHQTSAPAEAEYEIVAVPAGPDPDDERLFVINELAHINNLIAGYRRKSWLKSFVGSPDGPSLDELKHYRNKLYSYNNTIERYNDAIADGIIPFRIVVANVGALKDRRIKLRISVRNGTLLLTRQLPQRPARPEGHQHITTYPSYNFLSGFVRTGVRLGKTTMVANFSELGPGEEAAVVNQTLFLSLTEQTTVHFELSSQRFDQLRGEVPL